MERKPSLESSLRKSLLKKREEMNLADFQVTTLHAQTASAFIATVGDETPRYFCQYISAYSHRALKGHVPFTIIETFLQCISHFA
jgi:hypothetical protein